MQKLSKITWPFPEILVLCYFAEGSACLGMPDQIQQILHLTKASMDI